MSTDNTRHINLVDTNKLIRADLKRNFPGVKFSVRGERASMMTATRISWDDGPDEKAVDAVVADYKAMQPDSHNTDYWDARYTTDENGHRVHYGSDYITTSRRISEKYMEAARTKTAQLLGVDEVHDHGYTPEDGVNLYAVEEFTGHPIHNGYAFGATLIRWVAGRLAECDHLGTDADEELAKRRRQADLEAATFQAVRETGGSFEDAHDAVRALTDPKAVQVDKERAEAYAQEQQGKLMDADEYAKTVAEEEANCADPERAAFWNAEAEADDARGILAEFLDDLDPRYYATFAVLDHTKRHH